MKTTINPMHNLMMEMGIATTFYFIPQSFSRNRTDTTKSLNWLVKFSRQGCADIVTEYMQGLGYVPTNSIMTPEMATMASEGRAYYSDGSPIIKSIPNPNPEDVLACVVRDAMAGVDDFHDFCMNFGYDEDSISARAMYDACGNARKELAQMFTSKELAELETATEDM